MPAVDEEKMLHDRLLRLLRARILSRQDGDVVSHFDRLFPRLDLDPMDFHQPVDARLRYELEEFLEYFDKPFLEACYARIFKRQIDDVGLADGLRSLRQEQCSRILMVGRLRNSPEGRQQGVAIAGLRWHYLLARLRRLPVVGGIVTMISGFGRVARLDLEKAHHEHANLAFDQTLEHTARAASGLLAGVHATHPVEPLADGAREVGAQAGVGGLGATSPGQAPQAWRHLPGLSGQRFVQAAYQYALGRPPTDTENHAALDRIETGAQTKLQFLANLLESPGSVRSVDDVIGLRAACRRETLYAVPVIGLLARLLRGLVLLPSVDNVLDYQSREITQRSEELADYQRALQQQYNESVERLRMELLQGLETDAQERESK
ncbi:MAG: hypothetical protein NXI15_06485 [Gammaproteobacteria bacterium]|nr:hypothetical protein [Gammaproteobacteria bacterium]